MRSMFDPIFTTPAHPGDPVDTGAGFVLRVWMRTWPAGTQWDDIEAGQPAFEVTLTEDGGRANTDQWHTGPEAGWIGVERWENRADGPVRVFHGWVDSESRRLLQAG